MDWRMESVLKLIEAYKQLPCLWNSEDKGYKNINVRRNAWQELAKKFGRSVQELKIKLKHLRSVYVTEKKRAECSEGYESRLYYYNDFKFLDHLIILRKPNLPESFNSSSAKRARSVSAEPNATTIDFETLIKERQSISSTGSNTRYTILQPPKYVVTHIANGRMANDVADDSGTLSAAWGALYRKLTPEQQLYANKTIMGVLYQGALGNLDQFSYKVMDNEHSSNNDFQFEKC